MEEKQSASERDRPSEIKKEAGYWTVLVRHPLLVYPIHSAAAALLEISTCPQADSGSFTFTMTRPYLANRPPQT